MWVDSMIDLTEDNVKLYSYKDVSFDKGVRYFPAIFVECGENEMDNIDLKATIINNTETVKLYKNIIESEPHGSAIETLAQDVQRLKEEKKDLMFQLQDEAMFGMYVCEGKGKVEDELKRAKSWAEGVIRKQQTDIDALKQIIAVWKR